MQNRTSCMLALNFCVQKGLQSQFYRESFEAKELNISKIQISEAWIHVVGPITYILTHLSRLKLHKYVAWTNLVAQKQRSWHNLHSGLVSEAQTNMPGPKTKLG